MNIKFLSRKDFVLIKRTFKYIKPYKNKYFLLVFLTILIMSLDLTLPYLIGNITGNFIDKQYSQLTNMIIFFCIVQIADIITNFYKDYNMTFVNNHVMCDINCELFRKVMILPVKAFDEMTVGDFLSRLNGDTNIVSRIVVDQSLSFIINIIKVLIVGIIIFKTNFILAWIPIIIFPLCLIIYTFFGNQLRQKNRIIRKISDKYYSCMHQSILSIREIKCLGIIEESIKIFKGNAAELKNKNIDMDKTSALSRFVNRFILSITKISIICIGGYLIYEGKLSTQNYLAFYLYSSTFIDSLNSILMFNSIVQQFLSSLERIFDLLDNSIYKDEEFGNKTLDQVKGNISIRNLTFSYDKRDKVLDEINIDVQPNKKVAIVGRSGAGKTTIFNLILKLYDPHKGYICIDNVNINELSEKALRDSIAIVRQEPFLFNMSIKGNLSIVNNQSSEEDIINACKLSYIHDYIMTLPDKYETIVGENGIKLSCGQRQRIAIARGLLKKSKVFLLDEATSSLDNESQFYVKKAIDEIVKDRTVILIAHRLSTIIDSDEIIVLDEGKIVGKGTHNSLINENYFYRKIYEDEYLIKVKMA